MVLIDHGSTYGTTLVDVDGNPLRGPDNKCLNVYTSALQEAFDSGRVRLIHCMKEPSYRYFVTSSGQDNYFKQNRSKAIGDKKLTFHVYVDEDIKRDSQTYTDTFVTKRGYFVPH